MSLSNYLVNKRQQGKRYFTLAELMHDHQLSKNAALNAISRLKAEGDLISPAKGLYIIVPPEHQPQGSIPPEELVPILMNHLKAPYYVSLLSAAQYYGSTHQKSASFQVVSNKRIKHALKFGQIKIEFLYKKSLNQLPTRDVVVNTGYLKVATPELVAFDLLTYLSKSGGLNHVATVLTELVEVIDAGKLIELADIVVEKAWLQRLGFILENIDCMDEKKMHKIIKRLERYLLGKVRHFIPLATELSKTEYPRIKKWMIIANTDIESDL